MPSAGPRVKKLRSPSALSVSCPGDSLNVNLRNTHDQHTTADAITLALPCETVKTLLVAKTPTIQLYCTCRTGVRSLLAIS